MTNPTREESGGVGVNELDGTLAPTLPSASDEPAEPRWCRFAAIWCRCGSSHRASTTMDVCAAHYMHEVVGADV